ncbi:MAG: 2'-5' RNA ligase family protein [Alphaproteobacteria bacterium]|nr:MAG: 2'-5' RNA ligase family protein [Alphaproteobacteria bacterium]
MGFFLNIKISNSSERAMTDLWDAIAAFEETPSMRALNYAPHFTFAIYDTDDVSETLRKTAVERAARGQTELHLTFDRIGVFEGPPFVLWADPRPQDPLLQMHKAIHDVIDPMLCRPYYRPGSWVPHCTVGMNIHEDRRADAVAFAQNFRGGVEAVFDVMECITFPSMHVVAEKRLPPPP